MPIVHPTRCEGLQAHSLMKFEMNMEILAWASFA